MGVHVATWHTWTVWREQGPPGERLCKAGRQNRPPGARSLAKDASGTVTRVPAFPPCRGSSGRARDGNKHARTHLYHAAGPIFSVPFLKSLCWAIKVASAVKCSTRGHTSSPSLAPSVAPATRSQGGPSRRVWGFRNCSLQPCTAPRGAVPPQAPLLSRSPGEAAAQCLKGSSTPTLSELPLCAPAPDGSPR